MFFKQTMHFNCDANGSRSAFGVHREEIPEIQLQSGVIILVFCIFGILSNGVSVWLFTRSTMRSSINALLSARSAIDQLLLVMAILVIVLPDFHYSGHWKSDPMLCFLSAKLFYPLMMMAQSASTWIFLLISIERYIAVCRPFQRARYTTRSKVYTSIIAVILMAVAYNAVRFWEFRSIPESPCAPAWLLRSNDFYFYIYFTGLYFCTHFAIPFGILLVLNIQIVAGLRQDKLLLESTRFLCRPRELKRRRKRGATTIMIIIVTVFFTVCNILPFTLNIIEAVLPELFRCPAKQVLAVKLMSISNLLVVVNNSCTFFIYVIFCEKYRKLLRGCSCVRFPKRTECAVTVKEAKQRSPRQTETAGLPTIEVSPSYRSRVSTYLKTPINTAECRSRVSTYSKPTSSNRSSMQLSPKFSHAFNYSYNEKVPLHQTNTLGTLGTGTGYSFSGHSLDQNSTCSFDTVTLFKVCVTDNTSNDVGCIVLERSS